jgi:toxin FitB
LYLLDSNVLNAYCGTDTPNKKVRLWMDSVDDPDVYINVIVVAESKRAIEKGRRNAKCNMRKLKQKEETLREIIVSYADRILNIDIDTAMVWGELLSYEKNERRTRDLGLAASAKVRNYTVVTRNVDDFKGRGVRLLNPFKTPPDIVEIG